MLAIILWLRAACSAAVCSGAAAFLLLWLQGHVGPAGGTPHLPPGAPTLVSMAGQGNACWLALAVAGWDGARLVRCSL